MIKNISRGKYNSLTGFVLIGVILLKATGLISGNVLEISLYVSAGISSILQLFSDDPKSGK